MGLAVFGYFILSNDPATCRWLSAEEKELASQRIMAENVGSTKVVEKFQWKNVWKAMSSGFVLSMGLAFTLINISVQGLSLFTPTVVRTIYPGLTTVQTQVTLLFPSNLWLSLISLLTFYSSEQFPHTSPPGSSR